MQKTTKRIGEILLEKRLITEAQLHDALSEQNLSNGFLGTILVNKGWISDRQLMEALSEQFDIPLVDLKKEQINMELTSEFSSSLILDHKCFPLSKNDVSITVAIVNPLNAVAISKIEEEAKPRKVKLALVPEEDLKDILQNYRQYINQNIQRLLRRDKKP
jgi:ATP-dependent exoDNAse (exonuclease V) alpha subunit